MRPGRRATAAALAALLAWSGSAQAADEPLGSDKALHFTVSGAIASGGYVLGALAHQPTAARLTLAVGLGVTAGVAKELWDTAGHGTPSALDLAWDLGGVVVGTLICWGVERLIQTLWPVTAESAAPRQFAAAR